MTRSPVSFAELVELPGGCGRIRAAECTPEHHCRVTVLRLTAPEAAPADRGRRFTDGPTVAATDNALAGVELAAFPAGSPGTGLAEGRE